jgi:Fe/S biogenesis protein NfuA
MADAMAKNNTGPLALRIKVYGEPEAGNLQSEFTFMKLEDAEETDKIQEAGPFQIYFDPESKEKIKGSVVDFDEKKYMSGFNIQYHNQKPIEPSKIWDDEVSQAVQKVLDEQINPSLSSHGGWVSLLEVKEDKAYIEMGGGCKGCARSQMTIKQGVERLVTHSVPQITTILDVTDHAEGENPYYTE